MVIPTLKQDFMRNNGTTVAKTDRYSSTRIINLTLTYTQPDAAQVPTAVFCLIQRVVLRAPRSYRAAMASILAQRLFTDS